jgi:hypothetical protein
MSNWVTIVSENGNYAIPLVNLSNKDYMEWEARQEQMKIEKEGSGRRQELKKSRKEKCEVRQKENKKEFPVLSATTSEPPEKECELANVMQYEDDLEEQDTNWEDECAEQKYYRKQQKSEV